MPNALVIIPAFNEAANLGILLPQLRRIPGIYPVVVNDHSSDATEEVCRRFNASVIENKLNKGRDNAIRSALQELDINEHEWAVTFDADLQHDINFLERLIARRQWPLIVKGARFHPESPQINTPIDRKALSLLLSDVVTSLIGWHVHDLNCGLLAIHRSIIHQIKDFCKFDRHLSAEVLFMAYLCDWGEACFYELPIPACYTIRNARDLNKYLESSSAHRFFDRADSIVSKIFQMVGPSQFSANIAAVQTYTAIRTRDLDLYQSYLKRSLSSDL